MTRLFMVTLVLLMTGPVYAEWVKVSDGDEAGKTIYVNPATIRRNSNLVKMWQLYDYKTVQTIGGIRFLTAEEQWEFDCAEERGRVLALDGQHVIDVQSETGCPDVDSARETGRSLATTALEQGAGVLVEVAR